MPGGHGELIMPPESSDFPGGLLVAARDVGGQMEIEEVASCLDNSSQVSPCRPWLWRRSGWLDRLGIPAPAWWWTSAWRPSGGFSPAKPSGFSPAARLRQHHARQHHARPRHRHNARQGRPRWPDRAEPSLPWAVGPAAGLPPWSTTAGPLRREPHHRPDQQRQHLRPPDRHPRRQPRPRREHLRGRLDGIGRGDGRRQPVRLREGNVRGGGSRERVV